MAAEVGCDFFAGEGGLVASSSSSCASELMSDVPDGWIAHARFFLLTNGLGISSGLGGRFDDMIVGSASNKSPGSRFVFWARYFTIDLESPHWCPGLLIAYLLIQIVTTSKENICTVVLS